MNWIHDLARCYAGALQTSISTVLHKMTKKEHINFI